jgi:hypothetical protein
MCLRVVTPIPAAARSGFLDVNWGRVERAVVRALDSAGAGGAGGELSTGDLHAGLSKLQTVLTFNLPGGTGFASGLTFALGGRLGRVLVLTSAACAAAPLGTAHAYASSRTFRQELEQHVPALASALNAALEHSGARAALLSAAAAARELSMRKPPTLEELRREEARAKLEARLLTGDNKMTPQKEVALARIEKTLLRIEADKREAKKRAKQEAMEARQKKR